ncbi:OmpA family protein [Photobacterium sp. 1_MG-2023]|uniref:MotY family protein n=1 Tax=Photobacterium sp. 1_MG-2023 TaxID=3062646 RepID=UPI0026E391A4|nr:OmpA family protein [Photobacterium sp. 1_MG-2023]MDO6705480.1 OmpA family protein [Photobacterium sp. 1_MG-2023]
MLISFNKKYTFLLMTLAAVSSAEAQVVSTPMDLVEWKYQGGKFQCSLNQQVHQFGEVSFIADAGEELVLKVKPLRPVAQYDNAGLYLQDGPWVESPTQKPLTPGQQMSPLEVTFTGMADALLDGMMAGQWARVSLMYQRPSTPVDVMLSSVNMSGPLAQFNECRSRLPAMSYKQARDLVFQFELGQRTVSASQKETLMNLADYIRRDTSIRKVLVDGHTDSVGSNLGNIQVSKVRADDVASFLREAGVKDGLIQTRAHGSRYPVASNKTADGQALNRRVTVRVLRADNHEKSRVQ